MEDEKRSADVEQGEKILREKVGEYKKAHPERLPELDYALMLKSLDKVSESSPVKIACNAFNEKREWIPGTTTWNVGRVYLSDDHCVVFTVNHGDRIMTVDRLNDELVSINKKLPLKNVPVLIEVKEGSLVRATDLYAHSLVSSVWAGLPLDFVLCYTQKQEKKKVPADE